LVLGFFGPLKKAGNGWTYFSVFDSYGFWVSTGFEEFAFGNLVDRTEDNSISKSGKVLNMKNTALCIKIQNILFKQRFLKYSFRFLLKSIPDFPVFRKKFQARAM